MEDETEEGVAEVSEDDLLLEEVCWVFEQGGRGKTVLRICKYDGREVGGANAVEMRCVEVRSFVS